MRLCHEPHSAFSYPVAIISKGEIFPWLIKMDHKNTWENEGVDRHILQLQH
jgi:hypothetical protein